MKKHYDFEQIEKEMQSFWKENSIYSFDISSPKEIYSIDTPPPTVSGSLHIGHIFSYAQAEMIAHFKRMQGYNVYYPFGFDDNGLPTERLVERDEGIIAKNLPRSEFIRKCTDTTEKYEKEFKELWQSLGFSVDWSLQYETINPIVQRISQKSFIRLVNEGKAYMKESPVLWCTECQTSIAQAELDTAYKETSFNYIQFMADKEKLTAATTRPELLYGCVCLFIDPNDDRYGKYIGKSAIVPLYNYTIPILADGTIDGAVPFIGGLRVIDARKQIIKLLSDNGLLIKSENITRTVAVHERCGKEIEIIPSRQWYIDILSSKKLFVEAADKINWYAACQSS